MTILDKYEYLCDSNIILNKETRSLLPTACLSRKVQVKNIKFDPDLVLDAFRKLSHLTFEVTQNCNMRCKYCVNNEHYPFEREFTNQYMDFEVAKRGLEFFWNKMKNRDNKMLSLSFYGGEPLLAFDTIKKIVNYGKRLYKDWKLRFTITTNVTLLTPEKFEFLILNSFSITVSLDGPKYIHDAKRVFVNGEGSFDGIWRNLLAINKFDNKYFQENVHFNCVYSKDLPISERLKFFSETPFLKDSTVTSSFVNFFHTDYYQKYKFDGDKFQDEIEQVIGDIKDKLLRKMKVSPGEYFFDKISNITGLNLRVFHSLGGACILSRPLIDVNGNLHFCDKISNKFSFGDVWSGINLKKLEKIITDYLRINERVCSKCDFRYLCRRCYINFAQDGVLKYEGNICNTQKRTISGQLNEYVKFKEKEIEYENASKGIQNKERYKFHQFVRVEKGCVNAAIINFITGDVYHVESIFIDKFENSDQSDICAFLKFLKEERLVIKTGCNTWVPYLDIEKVVPEMEAFSVDQVFTLEIEDGVDIGLVKSVFNSITPAEIIYYGNQKIDDFFPTIPISYKKKNFNICLSLAKVKCDFNKISEDDYILNMKQNSCWGRKVAITKDGKIRPCIYSDTIIGELCEELSVHLLIEKAREYWQITKDMVDKCKDCELRYVCFDCREIAQKENNGNIYAANPLCKYNPYKGEWIE